MKRYMWVLVGLLLLSCVGVATAVVGRHMVQTSPAIARKFGQPLPVQVVAAEPTTLKEVLGATGEAQPIAMVTLTAPMAARVEQVLVDVGDTVSAGQVLLQVDRQLFQAALNTAQSTMQQAAGELKRATQQAQRIQAAYGQGLSQAVLKTAQVTVDEAAGAIERAKQNLQRLQVADAEQLIPKTELDKAQAALETAQVHYWEAKEALLRTQKDLRLEVEQAQAALEAAHVRYQSAEEQLLRTQRELQRTTLVTPVTGMVMERLINPDETPQATQKLFTIGRIDQVLVETKIAQEWIGTVRLWQPGSATFQAFPNDELEGTVVKIQPVTDPQTKTFLVYLKIANPDLRLKPGMSSFVRLHSQHQGLAVPSVALLNPTGGPESSVFVVGPDAHARLQKVQVGKVADGMTEILGGLVRGEQVVVIGQFYLEDGDKVRIADTLEGVRNAGAVAYD